MASIVNLEGIRGDGFERHIPLQTGSPLRYLSVEEMNAIISVYPLIRMQARPKIGSNEISLDLSSLNGELVLLPATSELKISFAASKAKSAGVYVYDIQFSGPSVEPFTLLGGTLTLIQDVTDAPAT